MKSYMNLLCPRWATFPLPKSSRGCKTCFPWLVCAGDLCAVSVRVPDMQNNASSSLQNQHARGTKIHLTMTTTPLYRIELEKTSIIVFNIEKLTSVNQQKSGKRITFQRTQPLQSCRGNSNPYFQAMSLFWVMFGDLLYSTKKNEDEAKLALTQSSASQQRKLVSC